MRNFMGNYKIRNQEGNLFKDGREKQPMILIEGFLRLVYFQRALATWLAYAA